MSNNNLPKITLHWLEASRSQRVAWLLEELGVDYNLKLYHRINGLADPALKAIHPLGKSPLVELDYQDGSSPKVLAESGHIVNYFIKHFDVKGIFSDLTEDEIELAEYYSHFAEGSLQPLFLILILHSLALEKVPFFLKPIIGRFVSGVDGNFTIKEIEKQLVFLENILKENSTKNYTKGDPIYFVNNKFSGADVILIFNLHIVFEKGGRFGNFPLDRSRYPLLEQYVKQLESRPAFKRSEEKIKEKGNGEFVIHAA